MRSFSSRDPGGFLGHNSRKQYRPNHDDYRSLAGIMWSEIFAQYGENISFFGFSKNGAVVSTVVAVLASAGVWFELWIF